MLEINEYFAFVLDTLTNLLELPCLNYLDKQIMDLNLDLVHSRRTLVSEIIGERNKARDDKLQEISIYH